jgi:hypothetical protein
MNMNAFRMSPIVLTTLTVALSACSRGTDVEELGQQIGDVVASIDEAGGNSGSFALVAGAERTFARLAPGETRESWVARLIAEPAYAATCATASTFGACSSNVITRSFNDCNVLGATFSGNVTLTWGGGASNCSMTATGHTLTRVPAFTMTGRRGATLTVRKSGTNGQVLTKGSGNTFALASDGIRRTFVNAQGETTFDFTTETTAAMTITGTARTGRTLSGGTLRVTDHVQEEVCEFTPSSVTWAANCNCPVSGSWAGSCGGGARTASIEFTSCGVATVTLDGDSESITFDRCYGV